MLSVNFCISKLFIQCNTAGCYVYVLSGVNIYLLHISVSLLVPVCLVCVCLCVCDIESEYYRKPCYLCQTFSKFDSFEHKTHIKIVEHNIVEQNNTLDHKLSQRNKATKRTGGLDKIYKRQSKQYWGVFRKKSGIGTICQTRTGKNPDEKSLPLTTSQNSVIFCALGSFTFTITCKASFNLIFQWLAVSRSLPAILLSDWIFWETIYEIILILLTFLFTAIIHYVLVLTYFDG